MNEARDWVQRRRAQERGVILAPQETGPEFDDLRLGRGGLDPTDGESVLDWSIEQTRNTPVKFRFDW